jgi:cation diffusion facilitator CzcD-associated flavoprotein CzcO
VNWVTSRQEKVVSEKLQIAIVGGGIGGLTAALALRARIERNGF